MVHLVRLALKVLRRAHSKHLHREFCVNIEQPEIGEDAILVGVKPHWLLKCPTFGAQLRLDNGLEPRIEWNPLLREVHQGNVQDLAIGALGTGFHLDVGDSHDGIASHPSG